MAIRTRQDGSSNGATGTGDGEGAGETNQGGLSDAARQQVEELVNGAVNGAITNHLSRFKAAMTKELGDTLQGALGPIGEQLKTFASSQQAGPQGGKAKGGKVSDDDLPDSVREMLARQTTQIEEQKRQIEQLMEQNKREAQAREAETKTRMSSEERSAIASHLRGKGWSDPQIRAATAILHTEDQRVARDADGHIVFKQVRGTGAGQYVEELPIDKGLDTWLTTDEGKSFAPARQVQGTGAAGARAQGNQQGNDKKAAATSVLAEALLGLGGGGGV